MPVSLHEFVCYVEDPRGVHHLILGNSYLYRFVRPPTCYRIFVAKSIFRRNGASPRGGCRVQCGLQTDGNPDVHNQHTEMPKPGKPTLEFEVILSLFSNLTFVNNNIGLLVHNDRLERVA